MSEEKWVAATTADKVFAAAQARCQPVDYLFIHSRILRVCMYRGWLGGVNQAGFRSEHPPPMGPLQTWPAEGGFDLSGSSIWEVRETLPEGRPLTGVAEASLRCRRVTTTNRKKNKASVLRTRLCLQVKRNEYEKLQGVQQQLHVTSSRSGKPRIRKWKCHDGSGRRGAEAHRSIREGETGAAVNRETSSSWSRMSRPSLLDCSHYLHID